MTRTHTLLHVFSHDTVTEQVQRRKGGAVARENVDAAETLQWPRALYQGICVCPNLGLSVHPTVFLSISYVELALYQLGHPVLERHTYSLRLEALNLYGVHVRSSIQQYTQRARKHASNNSSLKYYILLQHNKNFTTYTILIVASFCTLFKEWFRFQRVLISISQTRLQTIYTAWILYAH